MNDNVGTANFGTGKIRTFIVEIADKRIPFTD